jgi:uncharacterized protein
MDPLIEIPGKDELSGALGGMPLFPLPQAVLFPNTILRLHVFEPRYVQLLEDCLEGNRFMAIPRLSPGWEDGPSPPPVFPVAGVGFVLHSAPVSERRYNIALLGMGRIRIEGEVPTGKMYRIAQGRLLEDSHVDQKALDGRISDLQMLLAQLALQNSEISGLFAPLLESGLEQGPLVNTLAHLLLRDADVRQRCLENACILERCSIVEEALASALLGGAFDE